MGFLDKMDPGLAKQLLSAAAELAKFIWKKEFGGDPEKDIAHVEWLRDRIVAEATITGYREGLQIGTDLGMALSAQAIAAEGVLEAMHKAASSPTVPVLDIQLVEVDAIDDAKADTNGEIDDPEDTKPGD